MTNEKMKVSTRFNRYKVYLLFLVLQNKKNKIMNEEKQKVLKKIFLEQLCHLQQHG